MDRPQKPLVFYNESETKPKTSKIGLVPITV